MSITLDPGTGGASLLTDQVAGVDCQVVKIGFSDAGVAPTQVATDNPLPVTFPGGVSVSNFPATQAVTGTFWQATQPVSIAAAVTVQQATAANLNATVTGSVSVSNFPGTQPISGAVTVSSGSITASQGGAPWTVKPDGTAWAQTGTSANVNVTNSVAVTGTFWQATQPVSGTVTANQGGAPWTDNLTQVASTVLGTPQTFGTAPSGVVIGTSSDVYVAGTRARSNQTTTAAGALDVNIVGTLGVTNSVTNGTFAAITDNTTKAGVIAATTALKTDLSSVAGTATVTAASGVPKVGISGAGAATLDAVITAATAPANGIATLGVNNTTAPSLATGQSAALQSAWDGSLFVKPHRRSNTKAATGNIASTTAATLLAAQASGVYADLSALVLTVDPTTAVAGLSVNISDGTNTYKFWFNPGPLPSTTVASMVPIVQINFDPPIAATSAATAWTIALSVADATVYYVANFILQKAS